MKVIQIKISRVNYKDILAIELKLALVQMKFNNS